MRSSANLARHQHILYYDHMTQVTFIVAHVCSTSTQCITCDQVVGLLYSVGIPHLLAQLYPIIKQEAARDRRRSHAARQQQRAELTSLICGNMHG